MDLASLREGVVGGAYDNDGFVTCVAIMEPYAIDARRLRTASGPSRRVGENAVASMASSRPRRRDGVDAMPHRRDAVDVIT